MTVAIIFLVTCILFITVILVKPSVEVKGHTVSIYYFPPLIGALSLIFLGEISLSEVVSGLTADSEINPIKILVLFLSMTLMSVFLDSVGFFRYLASYVLGHAKASQRSLFLWLYLIVSILTVFTSNDIIVLTFTPFICYFAHNAKIDAIPYLVCEFVAANTWSMALIIGNPTNIYLMTGTGVSFIDYTLTMIIPTALAGIVSFIILRLLFAKKLKKGFEASSQKVKIEDKTLTAVGVMHLAICIVLMVISSYISLPMWIISFGCFVSLFVCASVILLFRKEGLHKIGETFKHAPYEIIPFVLSMFVLVLALEKVGVTGKIAEILSKGDTIFGYGLASFFGANLINNIPMSVLFSSVTETLALPQRLYALYASVAGSNLGAFLTPVGALAGIMWTAMLKKHGEKLSFARFICYGLIIALPSMIAAIIGLKLVF
ncbi:MAG: hypothetical protein II329_01420 [Clostridia bacterium]|nr:hypothetical protein [Clostridia bacterium]